MSAPNENQQILSGNGLGGPPADVNQGQQDAPPAASVNQPTSGSIPGAGQQPPARQGGSSVDDLSDPEVRESVRRILQHRKAGVIGQLLLDEYASQGRLSYDLGTGRAVHDQGPVAAGPAPGDTVDEDFSAMFQSLGQPGPSDVSQVHISMPDSPAAAKQLPAAPPLASQAASVPPGLGLASSAPPGLAQQRSMPAGVPGSFVPPPQPAYFPQQSTGSTQAPQSAPIAPPAPAGDPFSDAHNAANHGGNGGSSSGGNPGYWWDPYVGQSAQPLAQQPPAQQPFFQQPLVTPAPQQNYQQPASYATQAAQSQHAPQPHTRIGQGGPGAGQGGSGVSDDYQEYLRWRAAQGQGRQSGPPTSAPMVNMVGSSGANLPRGGGLASQTQGRPAVGQLRGPESDTDSEDSDSELPKFFAGNYRSMADFKGEKG